MMPRASSLNTQFELVKYTLPARSVATVFGVPMLVPNAGAGVGIGAPPAMVVIKYCCAQRALLAKNAINPIRYILKK